MSTSITPSLQFKFGASYNGTVKSATFSIYSGNATHVELALFRSPLGKVETDRIVVLQGEQGKWEITLSKEQLVRYPKVVYYGYRIWGPNWVYDPEWTPGSDRGFIRDCDNQGNRFNPNKLLIDPWARELSHDPKPRLSTIDPNEYEDAYYSGDVLRTIDTAKIAPKSMLVLQTDDLPPYNKPERLLKDDIIYEVNLRGFTKQDSTLPENVRGTYRGAAMKAAYLKELGVTAIEFLPVQQFANEQNDDNDPRGDNYWGYMTLGFFAPNRRYSSDKSAGGPTREFRNMVRAFHDADIKVILDVVYNHTGEGLLRRTSEDNDSREDDYKQFPDKACLLSFRGMDNAGFYTLRTSHADHGLTNQRYQDNSACGGSLNVASPLVQKFILDSLIYWSEYMGVDGFRFDLAPVLGNNRSSDSFQYDISQPASLLNKIRTTLTPRSQHSPSGIDLIAEPWATGSGNTYQLGQFPDGWAEWNDVYRTTLRQFENKLWVKDLPPYIIANALSGSDTEFRKHSSRKEPSPWNSVNYVASHDGYNLRDVVSYTGADDSWDHGGNPAEQRKAVRNMIALLMTSAGVPMITGGDELFRTQEGKTNVVALDTPSMHLDWSDISRYMDAVKNSNHDLVEQFQDSDVVRTYRFMRSMMLLRKQFPSLRPDSYYTGLDISGKGIRDISWYCSDGTEMVGTDWNRHRFIAWRIDNQEFRRPGDAGSLFIAYNWNDAFQECTLPQPLSGMRWYRYADTASWFEFSANCDSNPVLLDKSYGMHARSVLVLFEH